MSFGREFGRERRGRNATKREGRSRVARKERSSAKSGEHIWHADSSAHLSLFLPESKVAAAAAAVAMVARRGGGSQTGYGTGGDADTAGD